MEFAELKEEARDFASLFIKSEEEFLIRFHAQRFRYSAWEWETLLQLSQLYAWVMAGEISRREAVLRQKALLGRFRERRAGL